MNKMIRIQEKLYSLEKYLLDPKYLANYDYLEKILANGFTEYGSSGRVYCRADVLRELPEKKQTIVIQDFKVTRLSDDTMLTNYAAIKINENDKKTKTLRSSIWICNNDGQWQILFHQGTTSE